ncbi:hypothetical protein EWM64_g7351 [Hericium alpestre]|uniref:Uncharacterized protein n=1 Tax=Hericium alpestre TaxID=135208 RepID=A0A4Y9ZS85_9AGAM|nr:hypothetical protein EWM64_g7351 [Hericium alpestre]
MLRSLSTTVQDQFGIGFDLSYASPAAHHAIGPYPTIIPYQAALLYHNQTASTHPAVRTAQDPSAAQSSAALESYVCDSPDHWVYGHSQDGGYANMDADVAWGNGEMFAFLPATAQNQMRTTSDPLYSPPTAQPVIPTITSIHSGRSAHPPFTIQSSVPRPPILTPSEHGNAYSNAFDAVYGRSQDGTFGHENVDAGAMLAPAQTLASSLATVDGHSLISPAHSTYNTMPPAFTARWPTFGQPFSSTSPKTSLPMMQHYNPVPPAQSAPNAFTSVPAVETIVPVSLLPIEQEVFGYVRTANQRRYENFTSKTISFNDRVEGPGISIGHLLNNGSMDLIRDCDKYSRRIHLRRRPSADKPDVAVTFADLARQIAGRVNDFLGTHSGRAWAARENATIHQIVLLDIRRVSRGAWMITMAKSTVHT